MKNSMIIHPEELSRRWIDRLAEAGVGTLGIHPHGGNESVSSLEKLLECLKTDQYRGLIDYAHSRGIEVEYEIHAAGWLMPRELFAEHPEYFRMNKRGERVADYNFCTSCTEGLELAAGRAAELALSLYGSCRRFNFWMDDGVGIGCRCPRCQGLSFSDQQLIFLNRALKRIRSVRPDAELAYLAYMDTLAPPTVTVPEEGIFLEYAPMQKYTARGDGAAERIAKEREMLLPLTDLFCGGVKVLEYWYDNSMLSRWKKPPARFTLDCEAMWRDIAEYRSMGIDYVSTFACFLGDDYEELYGEVDITPFAQKTVG